MYPHPFFKILFSFVVLLVFASVSSAQFEDNFNTPLLKDPTGAEGWAFFTGDGDATIDFQQGDGHAKILVDATNDKQNIWWALIKRQISPSLDLKKLSKPGYELQVEARIKASHPFKRVNLSVNSQRTIDFHSDLMEFYIEDTASWHTIRFTTQDFGAKPGDTIFAQLALMDWGLDTYQVDIDYFKVNVVNLKNADQSKGVLTPYHPPIPEISSFKNHLPVEEDAIVDLQYPDLNFNNWSVLEEEGNKPILNVNGTQWVILRWNLEEFAGRKAKGSGLLELTTYSLQNNPDYKKDFGMMRIVEILDGDPKWKEEDVNLNSLLQGKSLNEVFNSQMIIDVEVTPGEGNKSHITIPQHVLQRMLEGKTPGIVLKPLGAVNASFYAKENKEAPLTPKLHLNLEAATP